MSTAPSGKTSRQGQRIRVRGIVQGVGFRPAIWRLANACGLHGHVFNDAQGVVIELHGEAGQIDDFHAQLAQAYPPLSQVDAIDIQTIAYQGSQGFHIAPSQGGQQNTPVTPDAVLCDQCRAEIRNPQNRRYGYAFTNCTQCGPRLSIVSAIPYDRCNTAMASFSQCTACEQEYQNPADRRFHAQPNACPACGPALWLQDHAQHTSTQVLEAAAQAVRNGQIVALKGIGGFHLICDAQNQQAIATLRQRKHRPSKPLALMARDLEQAQTHVDISTAEAALLQSPAAPVVLLKKQANCRLPEALAPGQSELGFMLAYSPLHQLLLDALDGPIVATSGNLSGQPPCIENEQALEQLHEIADTFVLHNRLIVNRVDDSVVRLHRQQVQILRRARGYAPSPLTLPAGFEDAPPLLAMGGELKNTFCLIQQGQAVLSQHIGDLQNAETFDDYQHNLRLYQRLYQHQPQHIAIDKHPDYLASKHGRTLAEQAALPLHEIQHHHAHIAACLAEHGWPLQAGPVIGIALDGIGFGDDDTLWGGEVLLTDYHSYQRLAHLRPAPLPGGAQAMRQPWRNLLAQLHLTWGSAWPEQADRLAHALQQVPAETLSQWLDREQHCPLASSTGRLFDAVAAALNLCFEQIDFEGQAAMALEHLASIAAPAGLQPYSLTFTHQQIDPASLWPALLDDLRQQVPAAHIAWRFHAGLAEAFARAAHTTARQHGLQTVVLSGGVCQNRLLSDLLSQQLNTAGLEVLQHRAVPANDGGLALGQAVIAAARSLSEENTTCA